MQEVSIPALAAAVEANINAQVPLLYAHMPGVEAIDEPGLLGVMSDLPDLRLNSIYWASFPSQPEQVEARIDQVLARYRTRGQSPMTWVASPSTQPRDLGRYLQLTLASSVPLVWPASTTSLLSPRHEGRGSARP
jgi:hypothetical protein